MMEGLYMNGRNFCLCLVDYNNGGMWGSSVTLTYVLNFAYTKTGTSSAYYRSYKYTTPKEFL